ncbi:MAG: hypothetical protein KKG47_10845 [Proteobacteria bacterium]|nr:hypothetical protein [Pseudomonadota bacterium]MBU1738601.1 hypothetical protein [Pseudomonadota bacterium]
MSRKTPAGPANIRTTLIITTLILSVIGALFLNWESITETFSNKAALEEKKELQDEIENLRRKNEELAVKLVEAESPPEEEPIVIDERLIPPINLNQKTCEQLDARIQLFFRDLDDKEYFKSYGLKENSHDHFKKLIDKLLSNPPIVVRETDSLFTILTNTAHFYRVLGKDNVLLLKDILTRESDSLEPLLALFDQWSRSGHTCQNATTRIDLPLQGLYEYAGFFINTLGGQAYLFRRESNIRLLIKYYCIMILDRANAKIVNRHGIDIIPPLNSLVKELETSDTLVYREQYLRILHGLQDKYQASYNPTDTPSFMGRE